MNHDITFESLDELQRSQTDGAELRILDPGTQNLLMTLTVHGPDGPQQKRANERGQEESAARGANTPLTPTEELQVTNRYLARCCSAWSFADNQERPFNEDALYALLAKYPYIQVQVNAMAANRLRFIKRSQTA